MKHVGAIAFLAAAILWGAGCQMKTPPDMSAPTGEPSTPVPEVKAALDLTEYAGRVVLLDFWATWCAPCRSEIPELNRLYGEFKDSGVEMIGLSVDRGTPGEIASAAQALGVAYPVVQADAGLQAQFGGVRVIPTKLLVDKQGKVRKTFSGVVAHDELRAQIAALLAE